MTTLSTPQVNLNGTSGAALLDLWGDALRAMHRADAALAKCSPHGRDYLPQGGAGFLQAQTEHDRRRRVILAVLHELETVVQSICNQGDR